MDRAQRSVSGKLTWRLSEWKLFRYPTFTSSFSSRSSSEPDPSHQCASSLLSSFWYTSFSGSTVSSGFRCPQGENSFRKRSCCESQRSDSQGTECSSESVFSVRAGSELGSQSAKKPSAQKSSGTFHSRCIFTFSGSPTPGR